MKINFRKKLSDKTILVIGIVFIVTGISLGSLTWHSILTREQTLYDPNLSIEERARVEGSLLWWRELGSRLSYPLSAVLIIGGLLTIGLSHSFGADTSEINEGVKP